MSHPERAVISGLLQAQAAPEDVCLAVSDFTDRLCRKVFETILALHAEGRAVDLVTVCEAMGGGARLLVELGEITATVVGVNAPEHARLVRNAAQKRQALAVLQSTMLDLQRAETEADEVLGQAQAMLEQIATAGMGEYQTLGEALTDMLAHMREVAAARDRGEMLGVSTGLGSLNTMLGGGWQPGTLNVIAGRPRTGKTALALQMLGHAAKRAPVGIISLEMDNRALSTRITSMASELGYADLQRGRRLEEAERWVEKLGGLPVHLDESSYDLAEICNRITQWRRRHDIAVVAVDYLGLIDGAPGENRVQRIGASTRALKRLAKRLHLPILLLAQLNREAAGGRPGLEHLRESGDIEQDADVCLFLYAKPDDLDRDPRPIELGLLKHRAGVSGWITHYAFEFRGSVQRFFESQRTGWAG